MSETSIPATERCERERRNLHTTFCTLDRWLTQHPALCPADWRIDRGLGATADLDEQRARKLAELPVEWIVAEYARVLGVEVAQTATDRGPLLIAQGRVGDDDAPETWISVRVCGTPGTSFRDWVMDRAGR